MSYKRDSFRSLKIPSSNLMVPLAVTREPLPVMHTAGANANRLPEPLFFHADYES